MNNIFSPVLIVGSPRSGTTWLQRTLLQHEHICGGQESNFFLIFIHALQSVKRNNDNRGVGLSYYLSSSQIDNLIRHCWEYTFSEIYEDNDGKILLEKSPCHAMFLDDIAEVLPNAKFIHIIRDSRAVVASLIAANKTWGAKWAPSKAKEASIMWYSHVSKAKQSETAKVKSKYIEVYYEDLVSSTSHELQRIFDFIGIDYNEKLIDDLINQNTFEFNLKNKNVFVSKNNHLISEPDGFYRQGTIDGWKKDLGFFQKLIVWRYTRKLMKALGYDFKGTRRL